MEPGFAKRLVHILRAVYHTLRRGLCLKRLMVDLHLLLGRGKLAGKALRNLLVAAAQQHHHAHGAAGRAMVPAGSRAGAAATSSSPSDPSFLYHVDPRDVEFSCGTTPCHEPHSKALFPFKVRSRRGRGRGGLDVAELARAFERMSAQEAVASSSGSAGAETPSSMAAATPSPVRALSLGRSPAGVRQLRVTDSPFPVEPEGVDTRVDAAADSFIRRFYEQLRLQQAFATPDHGVVRRRG